MPKQMTSQEIANELRLLLEGDDGGEPAPIMIVDAFQLESLLADICSHYEATAPTVSEWADDLYRRLSQPDEITLSEIYFAESLCRDGWEQPNVSANRHYKLMHRLKRDTTGMAGF